MGLMKLMAMGGPCQSADDHTDYTPVHDDGREDAHHDRRAQKQEKRQRMKRVNRHKTESNF